MENVQDTMEIPSPIDQHPNPTQYNELDKKKTMIRTAITKLFNDSKVSPLDYMNRTKKLTEDIDQYNRLYEENLNFTKKNGKNFDEGKYKLFDQEYQEKFEKIRNKYQTYERKLNSVEESNNDNNQNLNNNNILVSNNNNRNLNSNHSENSNNNFGHYNEDLIFKGLKYLKKFDGEFLNFREFFTPLENVLDQLNLPDAMKLDILKDKLDDRSVQLISGLFYSDNNDYNRAKIKLKEHFYNENEIFNLILKDFAKEKRIEDEFDENQINKLLLGIEKTYKRLIMSGANEQVKEKFKFIIGSKLSKSMYQKIKSVSDTEIDVIIEILQECNRIAKERNTAINLSMNYETNTIRQTTNQIRNNINNNNNITSAATMNRFICYFCNNNSHNTVDCRSQINPSEKKRIIQSRNLCHNCFKTNHRATDCRNVRRCSICLQKHHPLFCNNNSNNNINRNNNQNNNQNFLVTQSENNQSQSLSNLNESDNRDQQSNINETNFLAEISSDIFENYQLTTNETEIQDNNQQDGEDNKLYDELKIPQVKVQGKINNKHYELMIDTGSNMNVMTPSICNSLKLQPEKVNLDLILLGKRTKLENSVIATVKIGNIEKNLKFFVVEHLYDTIMLSRSSMVLFQLNIEPKNNELIAKQIYQKGMNSTETSMTKDNRMNQRSRNRSERYQQHQQNKENKYQKHSNDNRINKIFNSRPFQPMKPKTQPQQPPQNKIKSLTNPIHLAQHRRIHSGIKQFNDQSYQRRSNQCSQLHQHHRKPIVIKLHECHVKNDVNYQKTRNYKQMPLKELPRTSKRETYDDFHYTDRKNFSRDKINKKARFRYQPIDAGIPTQHLRRGDVMIKSKKS